MRHFIVVLIVFIISVYFGLKIAEDPGYAYFAYQGWSVEMPLWFAALTLMVLFLVGYFLGHLLDSIDSTVYRWKNWLRWRRKNKSYCKTNRGLIDLVERDWKNAEYYLLDGIQRSDAPLINYLAAAYAAHERGAYDKRDSYLRKAHDLAPHAEIAIGLTQAQLQYNQGKLEQALATLDHLQTIAPKHKAVLKLLERVYVHLADWHELLKLLPRLRKAKLIDDTELYNFEKKIYCELLNKAEGEQGVRAVWGTIPKKLQKEADVVCCYATRLLSYPDAAIELEALLSKTIKSGWHTELVKLYGLIVTSDPSKQLTKAAAWSKEYPSQAILLLTLGRLCMRCQLWGKARNYYESSLKLEANPETYAEFGKLLEQIGEPVAAAERYRDGLLLCSAQ